METKLETSYWAGRLIGYDQAWEVAKEIVEAIECAKKQGLQQRGSPLDLAQSEYRKLLDEEYEETVRFAAAHGWKSSRVDLGNELRKKIEELIALDRTTLPSLTNNKI